MRNYGLISHEDLTLIRFLQSFQYCLRHHQFQFRIFHLCINNQIVHLSLILQVTFQLQQQNNR